MAKPSENIKEIIEYLKNNLDIEITRDVDFEYDVGRVETLKIKLKICDIENGIFVDLCEEHTRL
jgi:hypothetical protein